MGKAQFIDQIIPMTLNETGEDSYYFSALYLKGKTFSKYAKIKENSVEVTTKFMSTRPSFRKIKIPKSISY